MKLLLKKVKFFIYALLIAFWYFYLTMFIYQQVDGHMLSASIWNMAILILLIIVDKIEIFVYRRLKQKAGPKPKLPIRLLVGYLSGATVKTALYLFYVFVYIAMAILAAEPDFPYLRSLTGYITSVQYGILIMIAMDAFIARLMKDVSDL